jgi:hypothetical protein
MSGTNNRVVMASTALPFFARHAPISIASACVVTAMLFWTLDAAGAFLYFSYIAAYALGLGVPGWGLLQFRGRRHTRLEAFVLTFFSAGMFAFVLSLPRLVTSNRKAFGLAAESITEGMSVTEVRAHMQGVAANPGYHSAEYPSTLGFYFLSAPGTQDVVLVRLSSDGQRVVGVEYSLD